MKKLFQRMMALVLVLGMVLALTGCDYEEYVTISETGEITTQSVSWVTEEELKLYTSALLGPEIEELSAEELDDMLWEENDGTYLGMTYDLDGNAYYAIDGDDDDILDVKNDPEEIQMSPTEVLMSFIAPDRENSDEYLSEEDSASMGEFFRVYIDFTLPYEIVCTNGMLSEDKHTAIFWLDYTDEDYFYNGDFYAYTAESDELIVLNGVNEDDFVTGDKVAAFSYDGIKEILVNGEKVKLEAPVKIKDAAGPDGDEGQGETAKGEEAAKKAVILSYVDTSKDGVYEITVTTEHAEKTFKVVKDKTAPKISGVKNKQTYNKNVTIKFSDATSGIKSATLNGKSIKTGKKVTKNGKYTLIVTDKAGNQKKITFTIKK